MTHSSLSERINRARGALLGLAVGDAIGTTVEFMPRGSFPTLTDMVGGGPFNLLAGQWTDDTSMALCLAASLIDNGFDTQDQMQRYLLWHDEGYMSSNGKCFDIGNATSDALERFRHSGDPLAGSTRPDSAGNGSIMRLAPVPIYFQDTPEEAIRMSCRQSRTTHQAPECIAACRLFAEVLIRALQGLMKEAVLAPVQLDTLMSSALMLIAAGEYKTKPETQIKGSGYVLESLEAAFWCFWQTDNFNDCVLLAANLGDDADTTAAIAGQLAGAFYGESGISVSWLQKLTMATEIGQMAEQLATERTLIPNA
jgi:ADP-ribosyl-[dinitrogen reductase] hydrolase